LACGEDDGRGAIHAAAPVDEQEQRRMEWARQQAVWELEERPTAYRDWALVTMEAEARARRDIERRHHRHQRKQR
jgi:hypothetical protein